MTRDRNSTVESRDKPRGKQRTRGVRLDKPLLMRMLSGRDESDLVGTDQQLYDALADLVEPKLRTSRRTPGKRANQEGKKIAFLERAIFGNRRIDESSAWLIASAIGIGGNRYKEMLHESQRPAMVRSSGTEPIGLLHPPRLNKHDRLLERVNEWDLRREDREPDYGLKILQDARELFIEEYNRGPHPRKQCSRAALLAYAIQKVGPSCFDEYRPMFRAMKSVATRDTPLARAVQWNLAKIFHKLSTVATDAVTRLQHLTSAARAYENTGAITPKLMQLEYPAPLTGIHIDLPCEADPGLDSVSVTRTAPAWRYQISSSMALTYRYSKAGKSMDAGVWHGRTQKIVKAVGTIIQEYSGDAQVSLRSARILTGCDRILLNAFAKEEHKRSLCWDLIDQTELMIDFLNGENCLVSETRRLETRAVMHAVQSFCSRNRGEHAKADEGVQSLLKTLVQLRQIGGADLYFMHIDPIYEMALEREGVVRFLANPDAF